MNEIKLQSRALSFTDEDETQEWDGEEFQALPCDLEKIKD